MDPSDSSEVFLLTPEAFPPYEGLRGARPECPLGPSFLEVEVEPQGEWLNPVSAPWWPLGSSEDIWAGGERVPSDTGRGGLLSTGWGLQTS